MTEEQIEKRFQELEERISNLEHENIDLNKRIEELEYEKNIRDMNYD